MIDTPSLDTMPLPTPSPRQLAWQAMESYAFIHFGMNTVTGREWGTGRENAADFRVGAVDADQWIDAIADAELSGVILTAKHHDGFCLWPTSTTSHSVSASPWEGGRGDVVRQVADAARRRGIRFGVYLSPWDRHDPTWGTGTAYDDLFVAQLEELLTGYGDVFCVWFDGAMGDEDGRTQPYDWDRYYETIRRLQPDAVINVCGPDVRWCGNEAGHTRANEWSVVPRVLRDVERIADHSQKVDDGSFSRQVLSVDEDLGSRAALRGHENELIWYPAEVNTSIRPGWFHHPEEDDQVRSGAELFEIYLSAVGGNATFLLGLAPDVNGRIPDPDVSSLAGLGRRVRNLRADCRTEVVALSSGAVRDAGTGGIGIWGETPSGGALELMNGTGWWAPSPDDTCPRVVLSIPAAHELYGVVVKEEISASQRVELVDVRIDDRTASLASAESVGYQRILTFEACRGATATISFPRSRGQVRIAGLALLTRPIGEDSASEQPTDAHAVPDGADGKAGARPLAPAGSREARHVGRRTFLTAVGGFTASLALAACMPTARAGGQQETITFYVSKPEVIDYFDGVIEQFHARQQTVRVVRDSTSSLPASFVRGNPPDLGCVGFNNTMVSFVEHGALSDLSDLPEADQVNPALWPLLAQTAEYRGHRSAIPFSVTAASVIYNKDIFESRGISVPSTWSEMEAVCDALTAAGVTPIYSTLKDPWTVGQGLFDYTVGGAIDVASTFAALDAEGSRVGKGASVSFEHAFAFPMQRVQKLVTWSNVDAASRAYGDGNTAFAQGRAAMYLQGPWALGEIAKTAPDLRLGTFPLPVTENPADNRVRVNVDLALWIPESSRKKDAARRFLSFLMSSEINSAYNAANGGYGTRTDSPPAANPALAGMQRYYDTAAFYLGPSAIIPTEIPVFNYAQAIALGSPAEQQLRILDADWARAALRKA